MTIHEFHALPIEETANRLETKLESGLTSAQAAQRIRDQGFNELTEQPKPGFLKLLLAQFNNFLVIILILAALVSLILGETIEAGAIFVIVLINAVVGVIQESKAEQALAALKKMAAPLAQVVRDGHQQTVPARELVPGDLVLVEAGNYVPADMRLIESHNLKVEEASLTGESVPVEKEAQVVLDAELSLGDRRNAVFMSTMITYGRGKGLVTATGMQTQIGLIAEMIQSYEAEETPLQRKLDQLAKVLGIICLTVCGIIFIYGLVRDTHLAGIVKDGLAAYFNNEKKQILELFMTAVSLAIAAVPEGLPAVVTICLALGMQKMVKRHALIRKLPAVETLGCTTIICSDKTGTLTQNEMTIVRVWADNKSIQVGGEGYHPFGDFRIKDDPIDPHADPVLPFMLLGGLLCNDARLDKKSNEQEKTDWHIIGDPTEGAIVVLAGKAGLWRASSEQAFPRIMELPFDSERKRMTTIHAVQNNQKLLPGSSSSSPFIAFVKGAPDIILEHCIHFLEHGQVIGLTPEKKQEILGHNIAMAHQALRVLGIAYKPLQTKPASPDHQVIEQELIFIGLFGMIDPARPEAKAAVKAAQVAGIKSVMVTGDYKDTAVAIAKEIGLLSPQGQVFTGAELDKMSDTELVSVIDRADAFCRVSPQHKTRIVEAFKTRGHVVAMTGDGVNDAPALKRANIGIAMGITGTDVSKQTADMVLTDDNFASIVSAIEEGRIIYANIRKFVFFLITCNIGEILIIFLAMLFGLPAPLKPVQLLMLNLVSDGAPALALGLEKGEPDIMKQPPRPTDEPVINRTMQISTVVQAVVMTAAILSVFAFARRLYPHNPAHAQTIAFCTLCFSELFRAFTARSQSYSLFSIGIFSNRWMLWATAGSALIVLTAIYVPVLQPVFNTVQLGLYDWLLMLPFMLMDSIAAEITKFFIRWKTA